jgi:hypothetical protein
MRQKLARLATESARAFAVHVVGEIFGRGVGLGIRAVGRLVRAVVTLYVAGIATA